MTGVGLEEYGKEEVELGRWSGIGRVRFKIQSGWADGVKQYKEFSLAGVR